MRDAGAAGAVGRANARIGEQAAQTEREIGTFNVARERAGYRREIAQQIANASTQGTALIGQPVDLIAGSVREAELDLAATRYEHELRARNLETQAQFDRFSAQQAESGGFMRAGTALLTGGSRIATRLGNTGSSGIPSTGTTTGGNRIRVKRPPLPGRASR